jgi:SSS family solute:Na+ symporter
LPNISTIDWLILLLYCTTVFGIGFSLKPYIKSRRDHFEAGRSLPAWLCALALVAASLGAPEVLTMAAAGARYGLDAARFFTLGALPALLFLGLVLMPVYYASGARTLPEYLRLRFGRLAGLLHAVLFLAMALFTAGLGLYLMASVFQSLRIFDRFFQSPGWYGHGSFALLVALSVLLVAAYLMQGGLAGTIYTQVVQFAVITAALLPLVYLGLRSTGGLAGLSSIVPAAALSSSGSLIALGLGVVFAMGSWCVDMRLVQIPLAARDAASARRAPAIAAALRLFVPLLFVVPGLVAIGLPTPQSTTTVTTTPDGAIVHTINVVPPAAAAGRGLVPAVVDPVTQQPLLAANGHPQLDYPMALPGVIVHFLPTGLLGLALAALLACCMSGLAANVTAIAAIVSIDLFPNPDPGPEPNSAPGSSPDYVRRPLLTGRLSAAVALLLAAAIAYGLHAVSSPVPALLLVFALVNIPLLVVVLLGMFWPRATAPGAVTGLIAGFLAALAHYALTLPADAGRGLSGGWFAVLHAYPSEFSQGFGAVFASFAASLVVAVAVSLVTAPRPQAQLAGLVSPIARSTVRSSAKKPANVPASTMNLDVRLPLGLMFTLMGAFLGAFGFSTRGAAIYSASLGLNVNLGCGLALMLSGLLLFLAGRRGQLEIEKRRPQPASGQK